MVYTYFIKKETARKKTQINFTCPGSRIIFSNKIKIIIIKVLYGVLVAACLITNSRTAERKFQTFFQKFASCKAVHRENQCNGSLARK